MTAEQRDLCSSGFAPPWGSVEVPGDLSGFVSVRRGGLGRMKRGRGGLWVPALPGEAGQARSPAGPQHGAPAPGRPPRHPCCPHHRAPSAAHGLTLEDRVFRMK